MARKGCGPYNLGAPKAIGKQIKDPKTGRVETTQSRASRDGIEGTLTTIRTTTPGTGGVDIGVKRKTYKQFEAEGGDVEAAKAYNASIAPTPDQVDIKERFTPDSAKLTAQPIKPFKPGTLKGEPIKPVAKPEKIYAVQADRGGGASNPGRRRPTAGMSTPGTTGKITAIPTWERPATAGQVKSMRRSIEAENAAVNEKYSEKNIRAQHAKKGGNLEKMLSDAKARRESNQSQMNVREIDYAEANKLKNRTYEEKRKSGTAYQSQNSPNNKLSSAFKMSGYPSDAIGKKYKK